jgi:DNA-binding transcriptional ArsR family regulator
MVEYKKKQLNLVFHALADTTRRTILQRISKRSCSVSELAAPFTMSLNAISKHLKVLEKAGLVKRIKKGRLHYFVLNPHPLEAANLLMTQLQQYWDKRLDALEDFLNYQQRSKNK